PAYPRRLPGPGRAGRPWSRSGLKAPPEGGRHAVRRVEWAHRGGHQPDHSSRGPGREDDGPLSRRGRGRSGAVPALLRPRHHRVRKFRMGGSHIGTGGDRYLMANRPSEGSRATRQALDDPSRENIRRYLRVHLDDESLVTDELVDYIHRAHTWSPEFMEARRKSVSTPHDYTPDLASIQAPVLLIHGRYDRMVAFEVSIAILNHIADSRLVLLNNCGHWPPFEKPAEWAAQVLAFLRGFEA